MVEPIVGLLVDGELVIDYFPEQVAFADEFLEQANPEWVQHGDGIITITASNARASYGVVHHDLARMWSIGVKSPDPLEEGDDDG